MSRRNIAVTCCFFEEFFNRGNLAVSDEIFALTCHANQLPDLPAGPQGQRLLAMLYRIAFPDLHFHVRYQIAADEQVIAGWQVAGTHRDVFFNHPPTGRQIRLEGHSIFRLHQEKIIDYWLIYDQQHLIRQLRLDCHLPLISQYPPEAFSAERQQLPLSI